MTRSCVVLVLAIVFLMVSAKGADSTVSTFTPADSSLDPSLFESINLSGKEETFWQQLLPSVSGDFYTLNDQSQVALSKELITWGDLATYFTSISLTGGEEAQQLLNNISNEISPYFFHQADGAYVAIQEAASPAQLSSSSNIFSKYALWREGHYQLYQTLLRQKESSHFDADLLEQQIQELRTESGKAIDSLTVAYRLATAQEWTDWKARNSRVIEVPVQGKVFGLLVINTENMQGVTEGQRAEQLLSSSTNQEALSNKDSLEREEATNFIEDHPFTSTGVALMSVGLITLTCSYQIGTALITLGAMSFVLGIYGFTVRKSWDVLKSLVGL